MKKSTLLAGALCALSLGAMLAGCGGNSSEDGTAAGTSNNAAAGTSNNAASNNAASSTSNTAASTGG